MPLEERRSRLTSVLSLNLSPWLLFSEAVEGDKGAVLFKHACAMSLEGIVSKRKGSPYISGLNYTRPGEDAPIVSEGAE